jgi:hypothetical protein
MAGLVVGVGVGIVRIYSDALVNNEGDGVDCQRGAWPVVIEVDEGADFLVIGIGTP